MISATGLELRAGSRILLSGATLRVQPGDRIGLVGRNGAGKTSTLRVLAGEAAPYAGRVERRGAVGYLPQDPRTGDLTGLARDRVLSARGLDRLLAEMRELEQRLAVAADDTLLRRYAACEDQFAALGGYAAEAEAADLRQPGLARSLAAAGHPLRWATAPDRTGLAAVPGTSAVRVAVDEPPTTSTRIRSWAARVPRGSPGWLVVSATTPLLEAVNKVVSRRHPGQ